MFGKRGAMVLFIRGLPAAITRKELRSLVQGVIQPHRALPLARQGAVAACDIICITDRDTNASEHHGLVEIHPAKVAIAAMRALNGTNCKGHRLEVRRYSYRSMLRDRRKQQQLAENGASGNRRAIDRRRSQLSIDLVNWYQDEGLSALLRFFSPRNAAKSIES